MSDTYIPSLRAQILTRRTYNRALNNEGTLFESWPQTIDRVIEHQRWLWKRQMRRALNKTQEAELEELRGLLLARKVGVAGRTLWLGGTEISKVREACQFNCAHLEIQTVDDMVDALWLLLQGCGVGVTPKSGGISGFTRPIHDIQIIRSTRTDKNGRETNLETWDPETKIWTISVGDTAEAWAKSVGKLLAGKYAATKLILDFSEIRPAGTRLTGYGWIGQGDETISVAYRAIAEIMNRRAGQPARWTSTTSATGWAPSSAPAAPPKSASSNTAPPSGRNSPYAKGLLEQRPAPARHVQQLLVFYNKPSRSELRGIFDLMLEAGGSEPGFINGAAALNRAPWFSGVNPCAEILSATAHSATSPPLTWQIQGRPQRHAPRHLSHRPRQLPPNLRQPQRRHPPALLARKQRLPAPLRRIPHRRRPPPRTSAPTNCAPCATAIMGAYSMAEELGLPLPKTSPPSNPKAPSQVLRHHRRRPQTLARYIFNNVTFVKHDPLVPVLRQAGYKIIPTPNGTGDWVITLPVCWNDVDLKKSATSKSTSKPPLTSSTATNC